ncbi:MAG: hypothetical protein AAGG01_21515 [Planctomycetota bacterium]
MTGDLKPFKGVHVSLRDLLMVIGFVIPALGMGAVSWFDAQSDIRALTMRIDHIEQGLSDEKRATLRWRERVDEKLDALLQRRTERSVPTEEIRPGYPGR